MERPEVADIAAKLAQFTDRWSPKVVARLNDYEIKLVKIEDEFVWHSHDDTDELFLVTAGELCIQMRDRTVRLNPGQLFVVPRGVEHCPVADGELVGDVDRAITAIRRQGDEATRLELTDAPLLQTIWRQEPNLWVALDKRGRRRALLSPTVDRSVARQSSSISRSVRW